MIDKPIFDIDKVNFDDSKIDYFNLSSVIKSSLGYVSDVNMQLVDSIDDVINYDRKLGFWYLNRFSIVVSFLKSRNYVGNKLFFSLKSSSLDLINEINIAVLLNNGNKVSLSIRYLGCENNKNTGQPFVKWQILYKNSSDNSGLPYKSDYICMPVSTDEFLTKPQEVVINKALAGNCFIDSNIFYLVPEKEIKDRFFLDYIKISGISFIIIGFIVFMVDNSSGNIVYIGNAGYKSVNFSKYSYVCSFNVYGECFRDADSFLRISYYYDNEFYAFAKRLEEELSKYKIKFLKYKIAGKSVRNYLDNYLVIEFK